MRHLVFTAVFLMSIGATCGATSAVHAQSQQSENEKEKMAAAEVVQGALDAVRARDLKRWLSHYSPDVTLTINGQTLYGRDALQQMYAPFFSSDIPMADILESGWTGERVYIWQNETYSNGIEIETYAEYEVRGGKIVAVYGRF